MPEFGTPFSGLASGRKLTAEELVRAVRFMVAAEYEAIQLYMQLAESTDNRLASRRVKAWHTLAAFEVTNQTTGIAQASRPSPFRKATARRISPTGSFPTSRSMAK